MATQAEVEAPLRRNPWAFLVLDAAGTTLAERDLGPGPRLAYLVILGLTQHHPGGNWVLPVQAT